MAFKVGDVVQLKSGGPIMTVTAETKDLQGITRLLCAWFDKNNEKSGVFPEGALEFYEGEVGPTIA
jgi:uncharacterized protein YodC (DUF2158 family)